MFNIKLKERDGEELAWLVICFKTTTRKAHVNYSVIKSLCVCFHVIMWPMGCMYLMDSEQPNKISLLWTDGQAPWVNWGAVSTSLADGPSFSLKWSGYLTTPACRNTSQHIHSKGQNTGQGKTSLFVMSCFLQLGSVSATRVTLFPMPGSEARAFNRLLLSACYMPGSILKAHTFESSQQECSWAQTLGLK